jgi:hypothetical protein
MSVDASGIPFINDPAIHRRFTRKAGALYGGIVALSFALIFWLPDALVLREAHFQGWWLKLVLGLLLTIPVSVVIGWLAVSTRWAGLSVLLWIVGGSLLAWIGGHIQFDAYSWLARLTDLYPSEQAMYPFSLAAAGFTGISMIVGAGVGLLIGVIGLIAVERAWEASTSRYGFSFKSIAMLWLCLPALLVLGLVADSQINTSTRGAITSVQQLIETVRDPQADLVRAKLGPMERHRARMSPNYIVYWNTISDELTRLSIDVQFDSGLVLRCPALLDYAYLCSDLGAKLDEAMTQLVTAEDWTCDNCGVQVAEPVRQWLKTERPTWGKLESVALLKHHGGWVYMRATFDGGLQIDCRFSGDLPITVDFCTKAR